MLLLSYLVPFIAWLSCKDSLGYPAIYLLWKNKYRNDVALDISDHFAKKNPTISIYFGLLFEYKSIYACWHLDVLHCSLLTCTYRFMIATIYIDKRWWIGDDSHKRSEYFILYNASTNWLWWSVFFVVGNDLLPASVIFIFFTQIIFLGRVRHALKHVMWSWLLVNNLLSWLRWMFTETCVNWQQ